MTMLAEPPVELAPVAPLREPDPAPWSVCGAPLQDAALRRRVAATIQRIAELLELDATFDERDLRDFASAQHALEFARDHVSELLARPDAAAASPAELVDTLREVHDLQLALGQASSAAQTRRLHDVQSALARLRGIGSIAQMIERAPAELARCGFDRVILSRVQDAVWYTEACHINGDPEWAADILRVGTEHAQPLDRMVLESEMVRRRTPMLVQDVQSDPRVHQAIAQASLSRSYVAAPIMPEGQVIGFLHADCYTSRRHVDEADLAVLWVFAEGFGYAFQRTVLTERLHALRQQVARMTGSITGVMDEFCHAETQIARLEREDAAAQRTATAVPFANSRIEELLTRREIEVLRLMAKGETNAGIAARLVVSEGTVKSHVKHILRKMRAANRAEAVCRFMRISALPAAA